MKTPEQVDLAIIGAGAAGLFAAAAAESAGLGTLLLERKARIGSKLLVTANGRCNFTKDVSPERMLADIGEPVKSFARTALEECPPAMIAAGFRARGLKIKRMTDGRLFPASEKAADVVHVFGDLLRERRIPLLVNAPVAGIVRRDGAFLVRLASFAVAARNVLVATGGCSFPKTGSVGDGQKFASLLGLEVEPLRAGLTGFDTRERFSPRRFERASAAVFSGGVELYRSSGEVELEPGGVSGAAVYNCSRFIARRGIADFELRLFVDAGEIVLRSPRMRPLKDAIVTMGGVSLAEIDPSTMQARKIPGLYFAGEVLDIDGPTGGYNLSLAFATARLAVRSMARRLNRAR